MELKRTIAKIVFEFISAKFFVYYDSLSVESIRHLEKFRTNDFEQLPETIQQQFISESENLLQCIAVEMIECIRKGHMYVHVKNAVIQCIVDLTARDIHECSTNQR